VDLGLGWPYGVSEQYCPGGPPGPRSGHVHGEAPTGGHDARGEDDQFPADRGGGRLARAGPAIVAAARVRFNTMTARTSQAAFAVKIPDGRCANAGRFRSVFTCSMIACRRHLVRGHGVKGRGSEERVEPVRVTLLPSAAIGPGPRGDRVLSRIYRIASA
jgi:hypothetical protein